MRHWLTTLASPQGLFRFFGWLVPPLAVATLLLMGIGLVWGLLFSPAHYLQGETYRIIYVHLPAAYLAQSLYVAMAAAGALSLIWRIKIADSFIVAVAPIGAGMTFLALLTGALWGKPTWGAWWHWDARITAMLLLLFLYLGIIALRTALEDSRSAAPACAVLALIGVVNIPIIKYSVEWWNTLHQPASLNLTSRSALPMDMWLPLVIMNVAYHLLVLWLIVLRLRNEILIREKRQPWVRELFRPQAH